MQANVIDYLTSPKINSLAYSTKHLYFSVLKHFYEINDVILNWKKISKYLGENERAIADRAYTKDEIQRMLNSADLREKVIVLLLCSTGMRIGALVDLTLSKLHKMEEHHMYKIKVYEKSRFSYSCFCTPECTTAIDTYLEYRRQCGEQFKPDTPLLRDQFDRNDSLRCQHPKALVVQGLSGILCNLLIECGIRVRQPIIEGQSNRVRKEVMLSHGFRKCTNTMMVKANLNVVVKEKLIGHAAFGLESSYFRPDDSLLVSSYLQAVHFLTISREHELLLENQKIEQRNTKLRENNKEIEELKEQYSKDREETRQQIRLDVKKELAELVGRLKPDILKQALS